MKPKIVFQKIVGGHASMREQSILASSLLHELTGKIVRHSPSGRPIIDESVDVSISHKEDIFCVGIVSNHHRIGIDLEHLFININTELFIGTVITRAEDAYLRSYCDTNGLALSSGIAIFWSIKEAFFKCLDYDFKPGNISVLKIYKNKRVLIGVSEEIRLLMKKRGLTLSFVKVDHKEHYVFSQVIMNFTEKLR